MEPADTYEKASVTLAERFTDRIEHAFRRIRANPNIGEQIGRGERRLLVRRYPYKVIYRILADRIVVVAVAHHKRRDGYWKRRKDSR